MNAAVEAAVDGARARVVSKILAWAAAPSVETYRAYYEARLEWEGAWLRFYGIECPSCDGWGERQLPQPVGIMTRMVQSAVPCQRCGGTGKVRPTLEQLADAEQAALCRAGECDHYTCTRGGTL